MSKSNPTRPRAPEDEKSVGDHTRAVDDTRPPLKDPRSRSAIDNIGVDDQGDLLDAELDDQPGDVDDRGRSFTADVRSDSPGNGSGGSR